MKKFLLSLAVLASAAVGASAAELYTLTFGVKANQASCNQYNQTWTLTQENQEWTISSFSNNNNSWTNIRFGNKKPANSGDGIVASTFPISGTLENVVINAQLQKTASNDKWTSCHVQTSATADFKTLTNNVEVLQSSFATSAKDVTVTLTTPVKDQYVRLYITKSTANSTDNGWFGLNSMTFNGTAAVVDPDAIATPEIAEPVAGTEGYTITLSCATEGAEIYYTTDGSTPTQSEEWPCAKYTGPFEIFEPCTLNAIAFKGEDKSAMLSKFLDLPVILSSLDRVADFEPAEGQTIKFVCNTPQATVAYQNGNYLYLYAGNGFMAKAYQCFGYDTPTLTPGQAITKIEGSYGFRYGQPQITNFTITAGEVGTAPAPIEIDAISGYIETYMVGRWYTIKGVNITSVSGLDAKMVLPADAALEREEETVALRNTFGLTSFEAGENLTVSGFVGIYNKTVQFLPTEILNEQGEKICALPVFSLEDGAYTENTEITISCETEGATIVYTVNGGAEVEAPAPAPLTLTGAMEISAYAKAEGYTNSDPVTASYTIKAEEPVIGTSATFDFSSAAEFAKITCTPAITYPTSDGQNVGGSEMTVNGVSVTTTDGSTATRLWAKDGTLRVYTGGSISVSIGSEFILSKITFTGTLKAETTTGYLDGKVWTAEKPETAARAAAKIQEVVFNCTGTNKITKIEVEVEFASTTTGIEAIEAEDAAPAVYYNLQGVRVENPANGLYIRVNGKKAEKVFIR